MSPPIDWLPLIEAYDDHECSREDLAAALALTDWYDLASTEPDWSNLYGPQPDRWEYLDWFDIPESLGDAERMWRAVDAVAYYFGIRSSMVKGSRRVDLARHVLTEPDGDGWRDLEPFKNSPAGVHLAKLKRAAELRDIDKKLRGEP